MTFCLLEISESYIDILSSLLQRCYRDGLELFHHAEAASRRGSIGLFAVRQGGVERSGAGRNALFSGIVLDYRIKVDSQDTEQYYPLSLCFGFK